MNESVHTSKEIQELIKVGKTYIANTLPGPHCACLEWQAQKQLLMQTGEMPEILQLMLGKRYGIIEML
jgi:hypothetical protein